MPDRSALTVTVCVLITGPDGYLLGLRSPTAAYAPGRLGLIGGHLELTDSGPDVLRTVARREVLEETGLEVDDLRYLESAVIDYAGTPQLTVTFAASARPEDVPQVRAADELDDVTWRTLPDLDADPRCPAWLPELIRRH